MKKEAALLGLKGRKRKPDTLTEIEKGPALGPRFDARSQTPTCRQLEERERKSRPIMLRNKRSCFVFFWSFEHKSSDAPRV